jgi:putative membrane protein
MQFLKTLFWVVLAIVLVLFAKANWTQVTMNLWGGLQMDAKLPVIVLFAFLLGFLPTFLILRGRIWSLKRRLEATGPVTVANMPGGPASSPASPAARSEEERIATDQKVWPA